MFWGILFADSVCKLTFFGFFFLYLCTCDLFILFFVIKMKCVFFLAKIVFLCIANIEMKLIQKLNLCQNGEGVTKLWHWKDDFSSYRHLIFTSCQLTRWDHWKFNCDWNIFLVKKQTGDPFSFLLYWKRYGKSPPTRKQPSRKILFVFFFFYLPKTNRNSIRDILLFFSFLFP